MPVVQVNVDHRINILRQVFLACRCLRISTTKFSVAERIEGATFVESLEYCEIFLNLLLSQKCSFPCDMQQF